MWSGDKFQYSINENDNRQSQQLLEKAGVRQKCEIAHAFVLILIYLLWLGVIWGNTRSLASLETLMENLIQNITLAGRKIRDWMFSSGDYRLQVPYK